MINVFIVSRKNTNVDSEVIDEIIINVIEESLEATHIYTGIEEDNRVMEFTTFVDIHGPRVFHDLEKDLSLETGCDIMIYNKNDD